MIPFENTWPYETVGNDMYVLECPFCKNSNVLLPMKRKELTDIRDGKKKLLVFPCCHSRITIVDADADYLLASSRIRK
ncbi:hypothetical protein [Paenibacillus thermotolerans]|uniref:hypothetical protein n=1 Tax=Paenibacillus thermotolerans TaxID=3027807 RepID=UPI002368734A|nr:MULTISPECIES: hypothetical protein [unclassified Paenibacillus]